MYAYYATENYIEYAHSTRCGTNKFEMDAGRRYTIHGFITREGKTITTK